MSSDDELLSTDDEPVSELQSSPCLQGERVAFTGTLASMPHRQAFDIVSGHGGEAAAHISRQTTMLVVGEEGWPLDEDGKASSKLEQAVELINSGVPLKILQESEWLRLLGLEQRERDVHRLFTPAMLQQKLSIPAGVVRRWERLGLIEPVQRVFRLPYFDFQEVTAVRRLQEMLQSGVPREQIEASLTRLRILLPSVEKPLAQLEILARDSRVVYRDERGLVEARSGQRMFDFDSESDSPSGSPTDCPSAQQQTGSPGTGPESEPVESAEADHSRRPDTIPLLRACPREGEPESWSAENWFDHGVELLGENELDESIEAFRMAVMQCPEDPEIHFHLASALYRTDNPQGALERYHVAVELDHEYIEAWTQLGCLRYELGDSRGALDAFGIALTAHPEYAEAMFHKADVLAGLGRADEAVELWKRYLDYDQEGPWAEIVRERLDATEFETAY